MANKIHFKKVVTYLLRESFREKGLWLCVFLLPISALMIGTAIPFIISNILANLAQNPSTFNWKEPIILLIFAVVFGVIANRISFLRLMSTQANTLKRIEEEQLESLLRKDASFFADRMSGKIVSDSSGLISSFVQFQDLLFINMFPFLITVLTGVTIVSLQSPAIGVGLLVMSAGVILSAIYASRKRSPLRELRHQALRDVRGHLADVVTNSQNVKIFAQEKAEMRMHSKLNKILTERRKFEWSLVTINGNNRILLILTLQILFIIMIIFLVQKNPALLSTGIFAFAFSITLTNRLFEVSTIVRGFENAVTEAAPMIDILSETPKITDINDAPDIKVTEGSLRLHDVSFGYEGSSAKEYLFNKLNIDIKPGEKVGLVGHSGGGKTTITKLLLRLVDISNGEILLDGQDIAKVTQQSLRKNIAFVPQEPMLFHRSIRENIAYGKTEATIEEITKVAKLAHAHEFIKDLPHGYDTLVGERGVKLSGGQRQRIAIARAMLKDAPVLILDEATSALDSESEVLIQKALWKLMEDRTAIVIAHRLSTIQKMDRIIVMNEGKILEEGSHSELIAKKGQYSELWAHQSGGFLEDD